MKRLLVYLKPYWKMVILAPLLMVIEVVCDLSQPTLLAKIVDDGIAKGDIDLIIRTGLLMVGVAFIGMIGGVGCTIASSIASQGFGADLRSAVFRKIQSFSFSNLDRFKPSTLITRLTNDITQLQQLVLMSLRIVVRAPLLFLGGILMAVSINSRLSTILFIAIPLQIIAFLYLMKKGFPLFTIMQQKIDRVNAVIRENLAGIRVVKAFVREDMEKSRFNSANEDLMNTSIRAFMPIITLMPFIMLVMNLSVVAVLWFGGLLVARENMHVGEIMAFINYLTQILFSLMMIGNIFIFISRASASAKRVSEVLDTEVDIENPANPDTNPITEGEVIFEDVSFSYDGTGEDPVLEDISFTAYPGETVAIIGTTGSGKSTLVSLIPRLYDVTKGRILIDGRDVREIDIDILRSAISIVLQETILFSGTIKENILWGNEFATDEEVIEIAKIAQAHDFIMSFPDGYDTQIGQRGVDLSGGQKQRIAIARALIKKPVILILDDCTSAVDLATERRILRGLKSISRCTTFIIAQRISTVMNADKILVLDDGRLIAQGTHSELLVTCPIYQDIYKSQIGEEAVIDA
ncbi:MAG TPA: ABC transporter ATP-binding protein [bacterium]|nr:ABC transporter ATP-binding protein [bacterium]